MSNYGEPPQPHDRPQDPPVAASDPTVGPVESVSFAGAAAVLPPAPRRRRKRAAIIGGAVVAVLLVGGGASWAFSMLSGGGAQPETVVPATAVAFARVDLDPSAGQKIEAYRFLRKFPSVEQGSGEGDLLGQVVRTVLKGDSAAKVDFDRDVKPWAGQRAGFAAVPKVSGKGTDNLVVLQVKDEPKARTTLRRLLDEAAARATAAQTMFGPGDPATPQGLVVRDGYALIGPDQPTTQRMSDDAARASLAQSANYSGDTSALGGQGVASAWADLDAVGTDAVGSSLGAIGTPGVSGGRVAGVVRFGGGDVELVAKVVGGKAQDAAGEPGGPLLAQLPADTTGALAVGHAPGYAEAITSVLDQVGGRDDAEEALGVKLPEDLQALLGSRFAVVVGDVTGAEPEVALRVTTTDPAASVRTFDTVLGSVAEQADGFFQVPTITHAPAPDGVVYAVDRGYAAKVAAGGTLGQDPVFADALPDVATASTAGYVSFDRVRAQTTDRELTTNLTPLKALGLTVRTSGGELDLRLRLVAR